MQLARPNSIAGWGRVDLSFIAEPSPYRLSVHDRTAGLVTGQTVQYTTTLSSPAAGSGDQPLRVMLVWTDPPPAPEASAQLVNDLDLSVTGPDGEIYWGMPRPMAIASITWKE